MINMPYEEIIEKIRSGSDLSSDDIESKIKKKMDQLSGLISKEGAAYIIANELGIKLVKTEGALKIKEIMPGMRSVETTGKVVRKFPVNEFERNGNKGKVGSFFIADETGQIRVTAWHDATDALAGFNEGDIVRIQSGYVRENQGQKEIHLNSQSRITVNPEGVKIDVEVSPQQSPDFEKKKISEIDENSGMVEIFGTVVQVFDPRFYAVCPVCNKKVQQQGDEFTCNEHGKVTPKYNYVMSLFIDDGSGNIRAAFFNRTALDLIKKTEDEMQTYRSSPEQFESVKTEILGETIKVFGRVNKNQMFDRLEIMANKVEVDVNPAEQIEEMKTHTDDKLPSIDEL